jgi:hypothetical protein
MYISILNLKIDISILNFLISIRRLISFKKWYLNWIELLESEIKISILKIIDWVLWFFSTSVVNNESFL